MPHFLSHKGQFSPQECELNKKVASLRIHVERYMERLKNWHFFDRVIPISCANIASDTWISASNNFVNDHAELQFCKHFRAIMQKLFML